MWWYSSSLILHLSSLLYSFIFVHGYKLRSTTITKSTTFYTSKRSVQQNFLDLYLVSLIIEKACWSFSLIECNDDWSTDKSFLFNIITWNERRKHSLINVTIQFQVYLYANIHLLNAHIVIFTDAWATHTFTSSWC